MKAVLKSLGLFSPEKNSPPQELKPLKVIPTRPIENKPKIVKVEEKEAEENKIFTEEEVMGKLYLRNADKTILIPIYKEAPEDIILYLKEVLDFQTTKKRQLIAIGEAIKYLIDKGKRVALLLIVFEYSNDYVKGDLAQQLYFLLINSYYTPLWQNLIKLPAGKDSDLLSKLNLFHSVEAVSTPNLELLMDKTLSSTEIIIHFKEYIYRISNWLQLKVRFRNLLTAIMEQIVKHDFMIIFCVVLAQCKLSNNKQDQEIIKAMYAPDLESFWESVARGSYENIWLKPTPKSISLYPTPEEKFFLNHPLDIILERYCHLASARFELEKVRIRLGHYDAIASYCSSWVKQIARWEPNSNPETMKPVFEEVIPILEKQATNYKAAGLLLILAIRFELSNYLNRCIIALNRANLSLFKESNLNQEMDIRHMAYAYAGETLQVMKQIKILRSEESASWKKKLWYAREGLSYFIESKEEDNREELIEKEAQILASTSSLPAKEYENTWRQYAAWKVELKEIERVQTIFDKIISFYQGKIIENFVSLAVLTRQADNEIAARHLAFLQLDPLSSVKSSCSPKI